MILLLVAVASLSLSACISPNSDQGTPLETTGKVYGFWNGVWDRMWSMLTTFSNVFLGTDYGIYQPHNNGNWYDLGYSGGFFFLVFLPFRIISWLLGLGD